MESEHVVVAAGRATAVVGSLQVSAAEIAFDREHHTLRCVGETTLRSADMTGKTRDATIDVGERKLFLLRTGNVSVGPATAAPQTANRISPHGVLEFSPAEAMPASAYQLRR